MHDISDNVYLVSGETDWNNYSVNEFLYNNFAFERESTCDKILFYVTTILNSLGFKNNLRGTKYLSMLITMYIVRTSYDQSAAVKEITEIYGTDIDEVTDSITASLVINGRFKHTASEILHLDLEEDECKSIPSAIEIVGAIYKKYFNYVTADETITTVRSINYGRFDLNGK